MFKISLLVSALLALSTPVLAEYPEKAIKFIVPWGEGGGTDTIARAFAKQGKKHLGVDINVVNKVGGEGILGMSNLRVARSDGYTVGMITFGLSTYNIMGLRKLSYRDYDLLQMVNQSPAALSVKAGSPLKTLEDAIQHVKNNQGRVKVGHTGAGGANHLSAASLESTHDIDFTFVPLVGGAATRTALLDDQIELAVTGIEEVKNEYDAGNIEILAVNSKTRHPEFPNIPTFAEAGYAVKTPILDWRGLALPKDVAPDKKAFLEAGFKKIFEDPEFIAEIEALGIALEYKNASEFKVFLAELEAVLDLSLDSVGLKR